MSVFEKLSIVQEKLKAPKSLYNEFGEYKYRSCEDILSAVKPLLRETGLVLRIEDSICHIGDRYYVQATARLTDVEAVEKAEKVTEITVTAYARETESRTKMDAAQLTGAASSYARKYALNGLFCIDDVKDPDATNTHGKGEKKISTAQAEALYNKLCELQKISDEAYMNCLKWIENAYTTAFEELTGEEWAKIYKAIERKVIALQNERK